MKVLEFLRSGGTVAELESRYFIKARRHLKHPNLVLLKYNQISSPFQEPLVRECRGLILDEDDNWRPVSRAFDKFFNHGEQLATDIDWSTARVQEKVDGSLCTLYRYGGEWHVATTGTPDASGPVEGNAFTFADLFWKTLGDFKERVSPNRVYMFELTSPFNRVVVAHAESRLTLLGVRNMDTLQEEPPGEGFPCVQSFPLQSFDDIAKSFETMEPLRQEGYVVVDGNFNRVKVKHPGYVAIHHLKGEQGPSLKRMLEIARSGEGAELLTHFPEWTPVYEEANAKLSALQTELETAYKQITADIGPSGTQKDFAMRAVKTRNSGALFSLRAGKVSSIRESLAQMPLDKLSDLTFSV